MTYRRFGAYFSNQEDFFYTEPLSSSRASTTFFDHRVEN